MQPLVHYLAYPPSSPFRLLLVVFGFTLRLTSLSVPCTLYGETQSGDPVARIQGPIGRFPLLVAVRIDRPTIRSEKSHCAGFFFEYPFIEENAEIDMCNETGV